MSDIKPYGLVCDLDPDPDVVGFVAGHQQVSKCFGTSPEICFLPCMVDVSIVAGHQQVSLSCRICCELQGVLWEIDKATANAGMLLPDGGPCTSNCATCTCLALCWRV